MVLSRPQAVEPQIGGEPSQPDLLVPYASVRTVLPAIAGEHHHHADIHRALLRSLCLARSENAFTGPRPRAIMAADVVPKPAPACDMRPPPPHRSARETRGGRRCSA